MGDLEFLFEFVLTVAALTVPVIVGIRMLAGDQSADPEARRQRRQPLPLSG